MQTFLNGGSDALGGEIAESLDINRFDSHFLRILEGVERVVV